MKKNKNILITLDGTDGCGKSTQIKLLYDFLKKEGYSVFLTREPGGTAVGDAVREILLDNKNTALLPITETLLYMASRTQLIYEVIKPQLKKGHIVLCDRWLDATIAYQGSAGGVDIAWIKTIAQKVTQGITPTLSLYLDLPVKIGLARATRHKKADRMEKKNILFHQKVRRGYLAIAKQEPKRFKTIALCENDSVEAIHERIKEMVKGVIGR